MNQKNIILENINEKKIKIIVKQFENIFLLITVENMFLNFFSCLSPEKILKDILIAEFSCAISILIKKRHFYKIF